MVDTSVNPQCTYCGTHLALGTTVVVQQQQIQGQATNGYAVTALVLGIVGFFLVPAGALTGIPALIFGLVALRQGISGANRGMAIAGVVMGIIHIVISLLLLMFIAFIFSEVSGW